MATLRGFPLDRANWAHHNSHRLDVIPLRRQQVIDFTTTDRARRGYRVNGKVLPVEERFFNHWNTDPWRLDYGGDGRELASAPCFSSPTTWACITASSRSPVSRASECLDSIQPVT